MSAPMSTWPHQQRSHFRPRMSAFSGDDIEVTWATLGGASEADWIGLYAAGAADSAALERKSTAGQLTGAAYFPAPKSAGTYGCATSAGAMPYESR